MAPPRSSVPRPGRTILALFVVMAALTGVMFLQGSLTPKLGLDLAGGTTVTLTAQTADGQSPPAEQMDQAVKIMTQRVNGLGVSDAEVAKQGSSNIVVNVPGQGQDRVVELIGTTAKLQFRQVYAMADGRPRTGASPGPAATPTAEQKAQEPQSPSPSASATPRGRAMSEALAAAPTPTPSASGSADPSPSPSGTPPGLPSGLPTAPGSQGVDYSGIKDKAVIEQFEKLNCYVPDKRVPGAADHTREWVAACDQKAEGGRVSKYILGPTRVQGQEVADAAAMPPDATQGQASWWVSLEFESKGAEQFGAVTTDAYRAYQQTPGSPRSQIAIVLDGQVVSAPRISQGPITGGTAQIDGSPESFTRAYASDLANVLKYGALPLEFTQSSIDEVSSTLGSDQLRGGMIAGAMGLGLVVLYCLLYYRGLGLVAVSSLAVAAGITYVSVVVLGENMGFRLSLPHIIGLIVSIGITADSFIVYFERLRDELRQGRRLRPSIEAAWKRARRTILVADAVTFLAALTLYFLALGGVRGFAFAMGLTTLIDVVVVFFFTKPLVGMLSRTRFFGRGHRLSGLDPTRLHKAAAGAAGTVLSKSTTSPKSPKSQEA